MLDAGFTLPASQHACQDARGVHDPRFLDVRPEYVECVLRFRQFWRVDATNMSDRADQNAPDVKARRATGPRRGLEAARRRFAVGPRRTAAVGRPAIHASRSIGTGLVLQWLAQRGQSELRRDSE